ncbi:pectate lyase [Stieleria sp. TO1_6]|uniref:pectate lyase n=1 Tax=Stieleria tagensis TaxID=2956795 RepID=UPI00209AF487|nr:pectate lyase [Stieleria tagensis]MCO8121002.1 pectate lyase [Stieleria tagensis]
MAFPSAEGYGKHTVGGRGGRVIDVINLNDSGEGSLRAAVDAKGPRTVVFRVSGTINLKSDIRIKNPHITIAGQTAPGDGICLRGYPLMISADEVIIRYLRVRFGDESEKDADAISARYVKNLILDHVSASWSVDETMSIYHCENVTVQWCIISESMFDSNHSKNQHGFGGIWGGNKSTYHHNLIAHHSSRNPRFASGCGDTDYRNNVVYNWGYRSCYGGEAEQKGFDNSKLSTINLIANYYKPGPATDPERMAELAEPSSRGADDRGRWYVNGNVIEGSPSVTTENWRGVRGSNFIKLDEPWDAMPINQQTAEEAFASVLDHAGATLPKRDAVDTRVIQEVRSGTATYEGVYKTLKRVADTSKPTGIIDSQKNVGGWPELTSTPAPKDTDHDGIPDEWETNHGLNPNEVTDGTAVGKGGYTMLEKYINSIQ